MRDAAKAAARGAAWIAVLPAIVTFTIKTMVMSRDRALEGSTQMLSLWPGLIGDYLRRAFLGHALSACAPSATVQFGTIFSQCGARIDENVYVGPRCHLGLVHLERDVLLAAGVHIPSGAETHGTADPDRPIREQPGKRTLLRVGQGTWIGSAAIILADVGAHCVIGAGAVVTHAIPDYSIAAGVPARVIRSRRQDAGAGRA